MVYTNKIIVCSHLGVVKPDVYKVYPEEPPNDTDVEGTLSCIQKNDSGLTEVNLNNIPVKMLC